jgi:hypothetical protein
MRRHFSLWVFVGLVAGAPACTGGEDAAKSGATGGRGGTTGGTSSAGKGSGGTTGGSAGKGTGGSGGSTGGNGGSAGKATGGSGGSTGGNGGSSGGNGGNGGSTGGASSGTGGESGEASTGGSAGSAGSGGSGGSSGASGSNSAGGTAGTSSQGALKIVIIGSSTPAGKNLDNATYGGTTLADSWPNRYAAYLDMVRPGSTIVNLAVSGAGTWEGLPTGSTNSVGAPAPDTAHNITAALAQNPDAIIVNFPSGDVVDDWTVDQVIANLHTIEDEATADGVPIWIATSQPAGGITSQQITMLEDQRTRTLADFGDHALDFWTPLAANDGTQKPELSLTDAAVHPNAEGHRLLFEVVKNEDIPGQL